MVIMDNYYPQEKCRELWLKIDQLHLSYLEMEESTEKISHRAKLEECIADYLSLAQHREKFVFMETEDVLYRSASFKKDFSGYKAATGWNALQIYASNLLTQPWRKEYRQIKTYCGFYKHQIEANLVGADTIFETMGYKHMGNGMLVLDGPICPDRVSNISKDCLIAYVECEILKQIWEEISPVSNISWLDILDYRANYPGSVDHCVKNLKYKYNPKQYRQPIASARTETYENKHQPATARSSSSVSNSHIAIPSGHMPIPSSHNYAALTGHNHVALPTVVVPSVPYCMPHSNGCPNNFGTYGYGTYPIPIAKQPIPATTNGYYYPGGIPVLSANIYPVPTGQLIELENRNGYDAVDESSSNRSRRPRIDSSGTIESESIVRNGHLTKNDVQTTREEKPEVSENWDYVYKNLEKQGYSKDLGERGDILALAVSDKQRKQNKELKKVAKATNLDEAMNNLSVNDRPLKMTEALEQLEKKTVEKVQQPKERRHSQGSSYENVVVNDTLKQTKAPSRTLQNTAMHSKPKDEVDSSKVTQNGGEFGNRMRGNEKVPVSKWECKSCTFLNDFSKDICEMCSKSRKIGQDQPMEVGGPECSKCTLVNPRSAKVCQACGSSLKNSPTYI